MKDAPPTATPIVPDHDLARRIGQGSYGEVWLARNVMGSFRAVKLVYRSSFESDRPYERELSGLQKFEPVSRTHPGLVSVLHVGKNNEAGYFYCVMEVADDVTAGQAIEPEKYQPRTLAAELARRGRLPVRECLNLGVTLAAALQHLHSKGLVHRDIKPSNIIFVQGLPKFADIGLVTHIGTKATFVGTEGYIPPEGPGSPLADLFSLGKVLYEASMGKAQDDFPELPTSLRDLPDGESLMRLNSLILKACDPQPSKRFRSAEDLRAALAELEAACGKLGRFASDPAGIRAVIAVSGNVGPELRFARALAERLKSERFQVFLDEQIEPSVNWARRLEEEIRRADTVLAIVSRPGSISEMMAYALEIAHQSSSASKRLPVTFPVVLDAGVNPPPLSLLFSRGLDPILVDSSATTPIDPCTQILARLEQTLVRQSPS